MGEYTNVSIYRMVTRPPFIRTKQDQLYWNLYKAKDNKEQTEAIYREIGFVLPNGQVHDLGMHFIEDDRFVYQTNRGVFGVDEMPDLTLSYKFFIHDFWLAILEPHELKMTDTQHIEATISSSDIFSRFNFIDRANLDNEGFLTSKVFSHYHQDVRPLLKYNDLIVIRIDPMFAEEGMDYPSAARKCITRQRQAISEQMLIPHWTKKVP